MTTTIVLIDKHQSFRQGVRSFLEISPDFCVVGEARDGVEGLALVEQLRPDIIVMEWLGPQLEGYRTTLQFLERFPKSLVLILTMRVDLVYINEIIRAGIRGYILKEETVACLTHAVLAAVTGSCFFSPRVKELMTGEVRKPAESHTSQAKLGRGN